MSAPDLFRARFDGMIDPRTRWSRSHRGCRGIASRPHWRRSSLIASARHRPRTPGGRLAFATHNESDFSAQKSSVPACSHRQRV